jgi:hypothetical protein
MTGTREGTGRRDFFPSFPSFPSRTIFAAAQRLPLDRPELFWTCLPSTGSH